MLAVVVMFALSCRAALPFCNVVLRFGSPKVDDVLFNAFVFFLCVVLKVKSESGEHASTRKCFALRCMCWNICIHVSFGPVSENFAHPPALQNCVGKLCWMCWKGVITPLRKCAMLECSANSRVCRNRIAMTSHVCPMRKNVSRACSCSHVCVVMPSSSPVLQCSVAFWFNNKCKLNKAVVKVRACQEIVIFVRACTFGNWISFQRRLYDADWYTQVRPSPCDFSARHKVQQTLSTMVVVIFSSRHKHQFNPLHLGAFSRFHEFMSRAW